MDAKATAWGYLRAQREAVLWKVEGLPERDQRMPMTPTGTTLLGVADETIEPLALDAPASVPWWRTPETDLHTLLVHMAVETARHAGLRGIAERSG